MTRLPVEAESEATKVLPSQVPGPGKVAPSKAEVVSDESVGTAAASEDVRTIRQRATVDKSMFISAKTTVRFNTITPTSFKQSNA